MSLLTIAILLQGQTPGVCSDDRKRLWLRGQIEPLMLAADSSTANKRRSMHLPLVHPDSVVYVDDERICERAAQAYYRGRLGLRPLRGVSVARVGDKWAVYGEIRAGEWTILTIFSRDFEPLISIGS